MVSYIMLRHAVGMLNSAFRDPDELVSNELDLKKDMLLILCFCIPGCQDLVQEVGRRRRKHFSSCCLAKQSTRC